MTDSHLLNAIRYLRRTHEGRVWVHVQQISAYLRTDPPDGASDCAEREADHLIEADIGDLVPQYDEMLAEAERRGLEIT
jgi:hypothetical protein